MRLFKALLSIFTRISPASGKLPRKSSWTFVSGSSVVGFTFDQLSHKREPTDVHDDNGNRVEGNTE